MRHIGPKLLKCILMKKNEKKLIYNITDEQVEYIQNHTVNYFYGKTIYWVYSERMDMYRPYLMAKKRARIPLVELLTYCKNQGLPVYPMTLRKSKFRTRIANRKEMLKMNNVGLLLGSVGIIKLINEYAKYCAVNYPIHIPEK